MMKQIFKNMKRYRLTEDNKANTSQDFDPILQKSKMECPAVKDRKPEFQYFDGAKFGLPNRQVLYRPYDVSGKTVGYSVLYNNQGLLYARKTDLNYKPLYVDNTLQKDGPITACNDILQSVRYELQMNPTQTSFVDEYISKNKNFTNTKPSQQQLAAKEFIPVDLHTIRKDLFTIPGEYFIYQRTSLQNTKIDIWKKWDENITGAGWTLEEPTDDYLRDKGLPLSDWLGGPKGKEVTNTAATSKTNVPTVYPTNNSDYYRILSGGQDAGRSQCQKDAKTLFQAMRRNDFLPAAGLKNNSDVLKMKDRLTWCVNDSGLTFIGGRLGIKDELNSLCNTSSKDNFFALGDRCKRSLSEENLRLKQVIRENLEKVMMEKKKSLLQEKKIIGGRFSVISENRNVKTKKQVVKVIDELISEAHYLTKQGYDTKLINENLLDMFSGIFGGGIGKTITGTIKERVIEFLLSKLGLNPNGFFGLALSTAIGNVALGDVPKLISDCGFTTKLIAKTIAEIGVRKLQQKTGFENFLSDAVRNAIVDTLDQSSLAQNIENAISDFICPLMSGVKSKVENMTDTMKKGALQMT